jgi:hypothetical protein
MGRPEARKKAQPRHGMARNILVSGQHGPIYQAGFGPRSRPMGGHEHDPFKAHTRNGPYRGTKRPIYLLKPQSIPHFHVLDKEHKAKDNVSYMFL